MAEDDSKGRGGRGRLWSRDELLLAINLYCRLPFGHIDKGNSQVLALAALIGRSPSSVAWKLANFAYLDPSLDRGGAAHVSRLDRAVWNEFLADWDGLVEESEALWSQIVSDTSDQPTRSPVLAPEAPTDALSLRRQRTKQAFFRQMVCSAYDMRCCITGLAVPGLLVAGHIVPWSADAANRLNPRNGLCLNVLHHAALDQGLITVSEDHRVQVSSHLSTTDSPSAEQDLLVRYQGTQLAMPSRFRPDASFLRYHRDHVFLA